jgi:hypothetical protein
MGYSVELRFKAKIQSFQLSPFAQILNMFADQNFKALMEEDFNDDRIA